MRHLFLIVTVWALVAAKPELYREKEDFQYSRSSSDDGSKSGFYGAQRGNMGGNYEKAHNMDKLAQHQMSGLINQVQGELGDASKTKTGSVFTAANSRGMYGSGNYDLSHLEGRNFQESESTHDASNSHSSLSSYGAGHSSSSLHNEGYHSTQSQTARYGSRSLASGHSQQNLHSDNLQTADNVGASSYDYGHQASSGYQAQSGYQKQTAYDYNNADQQRSNSYGSNVQSRLVSTVPVRIIVRPGTRVTVPVATQTYDAGHSASSYDQNAINSEAEVLNNAEYERKRLNNAKNYESSYNYRKEWEKHDTKPVAVPMALPTINPFNKNSELYDNTQLQASGIDLQSAHSGSVNGRYDANIKSSLASQSRHMSGFNTQHSTSSAGSNTNAYTHGAYNTGMAADLTNANNDADTKPKSYQSSFSYHKSWERQGDPYIIKPSTNGLYDVQSSQRLTAGSTNQYGSNNRQLHQSYSSHSGAADCDCDENGHIRIARSYNNDQFEADQQQSQIISDGLEEMGQQTQNGWENLEDLGQQTQSKWDNLENLGQQTQEKWQLEDLGQQTQTKWDQLADHGQQTQHQWTNLEQSGQESINQWSNQENINQKDANEMDKEKKNPKTISNWNIFENINLQTQNKRTDLQKNNTSINSENNGNYNPSSPSTIHKPVEISFDNNAETADQQNKNYNHGTRQIQSTWDTLGNIGANDNEKKYGVQTSESQTIDVGNLDQFKWHQIPQSDNFSKEKHNLTSVLELVRQIEVNKKNKASSAQDHTLETSISKTTDKESQTTIEKSQSAYENTNSFHLTSMGHTQQGGVYTYYNQFSLPQSTSDNIAWNNRGYSSDLSHSDSWKHRYPANNNQDNMFNTNYNTQNLEDTTQIHQNVWNTLHQINKELISSNSNQESNGNTYSQTQTTSNHFPEDWRQLHSYHANNLGLTQNTNQQHQFNFDNSVYKPWQITTTNADVTTTEKAIDHKQTQDKEYRTLNIGRGDIDDTEVSQNTNTEIKHPEVFVIANNNKRFKTPEEIETLSLTKDHTTTIKPGKFNDPNIFLDTFKTTNQQSDSALSVISISEHKRLQEHEQNSHLPVTSTTTSKFGIYYNKNNSQVITNDQFIQNNNKHDLVNGNLNMSNTNSINITKLVSEHGDISKLNDMSETPVEPEQQKDHQFEDFGQQNQNLDQQLTWGQNMEDFGQQSAWGQDLEDFGQQSQSTWGQNLEDLGQQTQTEWGSNLKNLEQGNEGKIVDENLQQSTNTQQHFNTPLQEQQQQDFYKENYKVHQYNNQEQKIQSTDVHLSNSVTQKPSNVEILIPHEPTTEKPGFWKSVGSKFTSAKDTVSGWFRRN